MPSASAAGHGSLRRGAVSIGIFVFISQSQKSPPASGTEDYAAEGGPGVKSLGLDEGSVQQASHQRKMSA